MAVDWDATASDWQIGSYVDGGGGVLLAGYISHFRFYSAKLKQAVHGVYVGGGVGIGASVNANGLVQLADKAAGASNMLPSVGMPMTPQCLRAFSVRELVICPVSIFSAGVAAGVAPADIKVIQFGRFFQARQAQATLKLAVEVGANWTAGSFLSFYPWEYEDNTVRIERMTRKKATDPLWLGGMKM